MATHSKKALEEHAHLVLIDESGMLSAPLVRRTLAPRGQTPIIKQKGAHREKVSIIAALSLSPQLHRIGLYFKTRPKASFDGEQTALFLRQILNNLRGRVIVVWDNANIHRGQAVRELLKKFPRLWLEALPPYAPQLNPVEQLWTWLKWSKYANFAPRNSDDMNRRLLPTLRACRHQSTRLKSFYRASELPFPHGPLEI